MAVYDHEKISHDEATLRRSEYAGSGLAVGFDRTGERAQLVCWLLGRTSAERAKRLEIIRGKAGRQIATVALDNTVLYPTIVRAGGPVQPRRTHLATTSSLTQEVAGLVGGAYNLKEVSQYLEPDGEVPRLTGYVRVMRNYKSRTREDIVGFGLAARRQAHIAKPQEPLSEVPVESVLESWSAPGMGIAVPTYGEDGRLFSWPPAAVEFGATMETTAEHIRSLLPAEHFIAVGVKEIGPSFHEDYLVLNR